ncbi:response regulator [Maridesulfovibrio bastinii]|uniref:response regulator n=1 Tax=Maridesulfovibrio bastinii TaxID=47157 RepID=UPI00041FE2D5|nr:response regulator [Maridesulfovibrio bastinii]
MGEGKVNIGTRERSFRLATLITFAACGLILLAVAAVGSVIYQKSKSSLLSEFRDRVRAEGERAAVEVKSLILNSKARLDELSRDNTLRVSLKLHLDYQLQERLSDYDRPDGAVTFYVVPDEYDRIFSSHPTEIDSEVILNAAKKNHFEQRFFRSSDGRFFSIFSVPVKNRNDVIGSAVCVLNIKKAVASHILFSSASGSFLIMEGARFFRIGDGSSVFLGNSNISESLSGATMNGINGVIYRSSILPEAGYWVSYDSLNRMLDSIVMAAMPFIFVILTICIIGSLFLSRRLVSPLKKICDTADRIANGQDLSISKSHHRIREISILENSLSAMLSGLRKAEELQRYRLFFDSVSDIVWINDREGKLIEANVRVAEILGYLPEEFLSFAIQNLVPEEFHPDLAPITGNPRELYNGKSFEIPLLTKSGKTILSSVRPRIINYLGDQVFLCVVRDITDRKKKEDELKRYTVELLKAREEEEKNAARMAETLEQLEEAIHRSEEANRTKSKFLAQMSHEIRTPMNSILGMADMLEETGLSLEQNRYVKIFRDSGRVLLNLLNDILDLSKIESGRLNLENIPFSLDVLVDEVSGIMSADIIKKNLEFSCLISPEVPSELSGDPTRIKQILVNLISNAVKFTDTGSINCYFNLELLGSSEIRLNITVRDTGIGIPEEAINNIFGNFIQVDSSTTRKYGGTGLGLSITRNLIQMMGGDIAVASRVGEGSEFSFSIMLEAVEVESELNSASQQGFKNLKILVLNNNQLERDYIRQCFKYWGLDCVTVSDLSELKEMQSVPEFDGLLISESLNSSSGLAVAEKVRSFLNRADLEMCVLTSHNSLLASQPLMYEVFGLVGVSRWPLSRAELFRIAGIFKSRSDHESVEDLKPALRSARILVADDSESIRLLIELFLKDTPFKLHFAEDGKEAVLKYSQQKYDLVLMDIIMPDLNGYDAAKQIRSFEVENGYPRTPLIALTANTEESERIRCLESGFTEYLAKPVNKVSLIRVIAGYL